jgi:predicted nicotinamide N-methyase
MSGPEDDEFDGETGLDQLFTFTDYRKTTFEIPCYYPSEDASETERTGLASESRLSSLSIDLSISPQASTDYDLTGQILWPVSLLLSHYLASAKGQKAIRDKTVVELGAGTGLASMVAAHFARNVIVTDGNGDVVLDLLKQNVADFQKENTTSCRLSGMQLLWGDKKHFRRVMVEAAMDGNDQHVDVLIAADVVQWPEVVEPLLHTVKALLWESSAKQPTLLLGIVNRAASTYNLFFGLAEELGFITERISPDEFFEDGIVPEACREYGGRHTELYRVILNDRSEEPLLFDQDDNIDRTTGQGWNYA